jgi:hypothetical protein
MGIRMPCAMGGSGPGFTMRSRYRASECDFHRSCIVMLSGYTVGSPPGSATQETLQEENL